MICALMMCALIMFLPFATNTVFLYPFATKTVSLSPFATKPGLLPSPRSHRGSLHCKLLRYAPCALSMSFAMLSQCSHRDCESTAKEYLERVPLCSHRGQTLRRPAPSNATQGLTAPSSVGSPPVIWRACRSTCLPTWPFKSAARGTSSRTTTRGQLR